MSLSQTHISFTYTQMFLVVLPIKYICTYDSSHGKQVLELDWLCSSKKTPAPLLQQSCDMTAKRGGQTKTAH